MDFFLSSSIASTGCIISISLPYPKANSTPWNIASKLISKYILSLSTTVLIILINCLSLIWFIIEWLTLKVNVYFGILDLKLSVLNFQYSSKLKSLDLLKDLFVEVAYSILITL